MTLCLILSSWDDADDSSASVDEGLTKVIKSFNAVLMASLPQNNKIGYVETVFKANAKIPIITSGRLASYDNIISAVTCEPKVRYPNAAAPKSNNTIILFHKFQIFCPSFYTGLNKNDTLYNRNLTLEILSATYVCDNIFKALASVNVVTRNDPRTMYF